MIACVFRLLRPEGVGAKTCRFSWRGSQCCTGEDGHTGLCLNHARENPAESITALVRHLDLTFKTGAHVAKRSARLAF